METQAKGLTRYRLAGRSGLRMSPLTLGAGTFGEAWGPGWTVAEPVARKLFSAYLDSGSNTIDTADMYQGGTSEEWIGKFLKERGGRDRVVLATKFSMGMHQGDPNGGGNGRKHILEACEASLRRLKTDYVDLYWLHSWDGISPVEEVMSTLDRLVRDGKVRFEYSLVTREIDPEFVPAATAMGLGICPWSPLANGILSGKYKKTASGGVAGEGRLGKGGFATGINSDLRDRNERIVTALDAVSKELGRTPAQVALNWVTNRPRVTSTIIGVTKPEQLADNLGALEFSIPPALAARLDEASALPVQYPYNFFEGQMAVGIRCGTDIRPS
jgi:aryl-alcohol dehydrogenase-like predicted oxidoreductase